MVADAVRLRSLAAQVHAIAHYGVDVDRLAVKVRKMDSLFHHLEDLFDRTECEASRGYGHIHGNTRHVKQLLNAIEDCIHHMRDDIAKLRRLCYRTPYGTDCGYDRSSFYGGYGGSVYRAYGGHGGYGGHSYKRLGYGAPVHSAYGGKGGLSIGTKNFGLKIKF